MKKFFLFGCCVPMTVIFQNVTEHSLVQKVQQALQPIVMTRAERGFIEFSGTYSGDNEEVLKVLQTAIGSQANIEAKAKGELEIFITPKGP